MSLKINPRLRAWVKYTRSGQIIAGQFKYSESRPRGGIWIEVNANLCCSTIPPPKFEDFFEDFFE
jgi:hypothetical protein